MAEGLGETIITVAAIFTAGGVFVKGISEAVKLFKYKTERDVYKAKYDEIIKKLIDSSKG